MPFASRLLVLARPGSVPDHGLLVSSLTVHRLHPDRCALAVSGVWLENGRPSHGPVRAFIIASHRDLVSRCMASVGPERESHRGIRTAALLFDDLKVKTL